LKLSTCQTSKANFVAKQAMATPTQSLTVAVHHCTQQWLLPLLLHMLGIKILCLLLGTAKQALMLWLNLVIC
jgi:hypothetical protein